MFELKPDSGFEYYVKPDRGFELKVKSLLLDIFFVCIENIPESVSVKSAVSSRYYEDIKASIDYINDNLENPLTLSELASKAHMSRENYCRTFKKLTNEQPFHYINRLKIYRSLKYLSDGNSSITDIATLCGYQSISYFNRKFAEIMNCTPTEYRSLTRIQK